MRLAQRLPSKIEGLGRDLKTRVWRRGASRLFGQQGCFAAEYGAVRSRGTDHGLGKNVGLVWKSIHPRCQCGRYGAIAVDLRDEGDDAIWQMPEQFRVG